MASNESRVYHVDGVGFIGESGSYHAITIDPGIHREKKVAPSPIELLLLALGSCTASDVVSILRKKRVHVERFEVVVSGTRREEHPRIFTAMHVRYVVASDALQERDLERAIELSVTRYCSVSAMMRQGGVDLTHSFEIVRRP
jgi:putative redox protein